MPCSNEADLFRKQYSTYSTSIQDASNHLVRNQHIYIYTSMHCAVWSRSCPFKDWVSSDKSMTATHLADTSNIWHIVGPDEVLLMARHSPSTTPLTLNELMNQRLIRGSSGRNAFLSHSFRGGTRTFVSVGRVSWESSGWFLHGHSAQFVKNVKGSCKLNHGAL